jgi:hypothetical protein
MNTSDTIKQIFAIEKECDELRGKRSNLARQAQELADQLSVYWGEKYSGFKIGDVVEFTEKTWKRERVVRIKITGFNVHLPYDSDRNIDTYEDKHPTVIGIVVLKSGEIGVQEKRIYSHENIKITKVA